MEIELKHAETTGQEEFLIQQLSCNNFSSIKNC